MFPVEPINHDQGRRELRLAIELHDLVEMPVGKRSIGGGIDHPVAVDERTHLLQVRQIGDPSQVVEQNVVPGLDVLEILPQRDVEHRLLPHGAVETDLDEKGRLPHPGACHDDTQLTGRQSPLAASFENPDRASGVDLFHIHRARVLDCRVSSRFPCLAVSLVRTSWP